jgi:hypothetical protein
VLCVVAETKHRVERKRRRHDRESDDEQKVDTQDKRQFRLFQRIEDVAQTTTPGGGVLRRMIRRDCLRKSKVEQHRIRKAECCRKEERNVNAPVTQNPTDRWPKNKSKTKCSADQSHTFRAILFCRDVGDVSLRCRDVSACYAVENATDE